MTTREHINHESHTPEAWICRCGNTPDADGFYPCDSDGNEVSPTVTAWATGYYVCARCGRVVQQTSLEIVGRKADRVAVK